MYAVERAPAWHRDAKWLCGLLLVLALALSTLLVSLAALTREAPAVALLERVLQLTLLPQGETAIPLQAGLSYEAGTPLVLLPGVEGVVVDPSELDGFSVADARGRVAGVLADTLIAQGREALLARVSEPTLREQLARGLDNALLLATEALLSSSLMPAGLADGSRLANWQLQAQQNPGQPVQPIVGVFVTFPPAELQPLSAQQIGERVVRALAEVTLAEGLAAAQQLVGNANLQERLTVAVNQGVRGQLHTYIETLLADRQEEMARRLEQARELSARQQAAQAAQAQLQALADDLSDPVLANLASLAYADGADGVLALMRDPAQQSRLERAAPAVSALTAASHRRLARLSWLFGSVSALLLALLVAFSRGLYRLFNAGLAISLAAAGGAWGFWALYRRPHPASMPELAQEGPLGQLVGLLEYLLASLPDGALWLLARNHLIVLTVGLGLVALYLLLRLWRLVRPQRRAF